MGGAFVLSLRDTNYLKGSGKWKTRTQVRRDSLAVREMIRHISSMGTWSFNLPSVVKLPGAALVPLITVIAQALVSGILRQIVIG